MSDNPSVADSPYSSESAASPSRSDTDSAPIGSPMGQTHGELMGSPLGGAVEDIQMTNFNFDTLDTSSLLPDEQLLASLTEDHNVSVNLGKSEVIS